MTSTNSSRVVHLTSPGGPEKLAVSRLDLAPPASGEARLRHTAIGVNFIDIYHRTGLYPLPSVPAVLGLEGAGVVEEVGHGVASLAIGDRVAYASRPIGAYCERRNFPADRLVKIPPSMPDDVAAASMLKGMTARYLVRGAFHLERGHVAVVHAAAGGVGSILVPWAKHLGARVVGVVGSDAKRERALALGCDAVAVRPRESFVEAARALSNGRGADVVYDSVGADTIDASIECLAVRGLVVTFGQSSGRIPPFDLAKLAARSLFITRPTLFDYIATRADLDASASDLFDAFQRGILKREKPRSYALADAAQAHADLEGRRTTGSCVLVP